MNGQALQLNKETDLEKFIRLVTGTKGEHFLGAGKGKKIKHTSNVDLYYNYHNQEYQRYLTYNTFDWKWIDGERTPPKRDKKHIKQVRAFWVDLDVYTVGMTKEQALLGIKLFMEDNNIFYPTIIIDSGNGIYLIWLIEPQEVNSKVFLNAYERILKKLRELFADFGADSKSAEATHFLRLPNTINNSKKPGLPDEDKIVTILEIYENNIYTTWEFNAELFGTNEEEFYILKEKRKKDRDKKKKSKKPKLNRSKVKYIYNPYTLRQDLKGDLEKLIILRNKSGNLTGYREMLLFLYANAMRKGKEENILERLMIVNYTFTEPLEHSEVEKIARQMDNLEPKDTYKYKNETIITELNITPEEQKELKLLIGKAESRERERIAKKKRYEPIKKANQKELNDRNNEIVKLYQEGMTQVEIGKKFELTRKAIYHILNENGALDKEGRNRMIIELHEQGTKKAQIAREVNVSRPTVNSVIKAYEASK